jgi:hypothetical protein
MSMMTNELPFMLEIPNGIYEILTSQGNGQLDVNSDMYSLHTARFSEFSGKGKYVGENDELQKIITNKNISNYAFDDCKTFVSFRCYSEVDFTDDDFKAIMEEQCIETIKSNLIYQRVQYTDTNELEIKARQYFTDISENDLYTLKQSILIRNEFNKLNQVYAYYEAINKLIQQYSYLRKHFWVHKVDVNILEGTLIQNYLDGRFHDSITHAGLVPSILPSRKKYPQITDEEQVLMKNRLITNFEIPIEDELILVARSLWYRLEYRSAIIESSAALEVIVEKKLVEKMKLRVMSDADIQTEISKTETNFRQRCDVFLKKYTGQSFEHDNPTLWDTIDQYRKDYRHKIAHSDLDPDRVTTEKIINDFESAIKFIRSL